MSGNTLLRLPYLGFQQIEPSHALRETWHYARFVGARTRMAIEDEINRRRANITHFGVHRPRDNSGDAVLFDVIEKLFDWQFGSQNWVRERLRTPVDDAKLAGINAHARAVLVGGGGLLISDTNPNADSGWQWRITRERLQALDVPLILFAIGFNQFRGSKGFNDLFRDHLIATVDKSIFFGMRNWGSIERTRGFLPEELHHKVVYQPCMTTVLSRYHPLFARPAPEQNRKRLALNLAFDRMDLRFGSAKDDILGRIRRAVVELKARGWKVELVLHGWSDEPAAAYFRENGPDVDLKFLNLLSPDEIIDYYRSVPLTIGMRGHAQMIPFGCSNAIFSLISHDKMRFFLDDIGQPDWGAEIADPEITERILAFVDAFEKDPASYRRTIEAAKDPLWDVTRQNLASIRF